LQTQQASARGEVLKLIRGSLAKAEAYTRRYRILDMSLSITSIVLGSLATALAGGAVAGGDPVMDSLGGWRIVCSVVAAFTAIGTICGALHKTFQVTTRLANGLACIGKLKSLELSITVTGEDPATAAKTYQKILGEHPECLA
jgi:hypothetical protein